MNCKVCGQPENLTPVIYQVLVFCPALPHGVFHLTCGEDYRVCDNDGCDSILRFVKKALGSHSVTRNVLDLWTHAQIDWAVPSKKPWQIEHRRQPMGVC